MTHPLTHTERLDSRVGLGTGSGLHRNTLIESGLKNYYYVSLIVNIEKRL